MLRGLINNLKSKELNEVNLNLDFLVNFFYANNTQNAFADSDLPPIVAKEYLIFVDYLLNM